jgi:hypothetical protein
MKKYETFKMKISSCKSAASLACDLRKDIHYEERREGRIDLRSELKALYGAEAVSYYFHFLPALKALSVES